MENIHKKSLNKSPNWVGAFIRQKREDKGLSQKELGQMFSPPVTTQFVSNLERGITPIPAVHIQALVKSLEFNEQELMILMEKEYAAKLTHKIAGQHAEPGHHHESSPAVLIVPRNDEEFFKWIVQSFNNLGEVDRVQFKAQLKNWFELSLKRA
jgi:transcriptional regulator with XRE-family HTH domain